MSDRQPPTEKGPRGFFYVLTRGKDLSAQKLPIKLSR